MATPRKNPKDIQSAGRPSEYRPEYCAKLIEHMKHGGSIESFGSVANVSKQTIYNWFDQFPEFLDARKRGEPLLHAFFENLFKTAMTGQLRRVKTEEPMLDEKNQPILDPETGQVLMKRTYEEAHPAQSMGIFYAKNVLKWRDNHAIELTGKDGGPINFADKTDDDLRKELAQLQEQAKKFLKK